MKGSTLRHSLVFFFFVAAIARSDVNRHGRLEQASRPLTPDQCFPKTKQEAVVGTKSASAVANESPSHSSKSAGLFRFEIQATRSFSFDGSHPPAPRRKGISDLANRMAAARYAEAQTLQRQNRPLEAEAALREAIGFKPDFLEAHFELGVLLARQGAQQYSAAMDQFLEVLRVEPKHVDARINLSRLLEKSGDIHASVTELEEAMPFAAEKETLYLMLGEKQQKIRKYSEAIHSFRLALGLNPRLHSAHYGIGLALRSLGDFAGARSEFESALKLDPQDSLSHFQLGRMLEQEENTSRAIDHFEEALRLDSNIAAAYAELGSLYKRNNRTDDAEKALRQAVNLNPKLTKACYALAQLLQVKGKTEEANHFFDQVQRLKQNENSLEQAERMNAEGVHLMNVGKLDEALVAFRKALRSSPSFAVAAYNQGIVLARQDRVEEAIESFRAAIRSRPGFALAQYALGLMLRSNGDPSAEGQLRKAQLMKKLIQQGETVDSVRATEDSN